MLTQMIRLDPEVQPLMVNGVSLPGAELVLSVDNLLKISQIYFKSWDGSVNGSPPTGGGGANGKYIPTQTC